ncbi:uncharacterized protein KGF55_004432 [Candida pseudojiufengensis]|uniref:uncharacterized protein n=1 Tax=Candida pseudojiufengensis TaxID=497109 RepID=UPI002224022B|nr:uncharacterized protein KGF55_004432 [Candida pseudojiufengensis]KAI5960539.1 hypothetical protein KGF55_004432 [Candida pseudojiufengensis]
MSQQPNQPNSNQKRTTFDILGHKDQLNDLNYDKHKIPEELTKQNFVLFNQQYLSYSNGLQLRDVHKGDLTYTTYKHKVKFVDDEGNKSVASGSESERKYPTSYK